MSKFASDRARALYAETYDLRVPDWPGEIDFYTELAMRASREDGSILELACGTGRVAVRLAHAGARVVGLDSSAAMLAVARRKSDGMANVRWVEGDMRSFELGESFRLIIIPGHSFQNLLTAADQLACMQCIERHLDGEGVLVLHVDHMNMRWLGSLPVAHGDATPTVEMFSHPRTGSQIRSLQTWSYEPATQTAVSQTVTLREDNPKALLLTGEDLEGAQLEFTITEAPKHGRIKNSPPAIRYLPDLNFYGTDMLRFTVSDGNLTSAPATVTLTVQPVNDAPVGILQSLSTPLNTPVTASLGGSDVEDRA